MTLITAFIIIKFIFNIAGLAVLFLSLRAISKAILKEDNRRCSDVSPPPQPQGDLNSQTFSKQQDYGKDKALQSKDFLNKNLDDSRINSQLLCKQQDEGKLDKAPPSKSFLGKQLDEICFNSQLLSSKQQDDGKLDKAPQSTDYLNKNLDESCFNSQLLPSKHQDDRKLDQEQSSRDFLSKNLDESCINSQLLSSKQQDDGKLDNKAPPSTDFLNKKLDESCLNSQSLPCKQQNEEELDEALPSNDFPNKSPKRHNFNFQLVFKQRNKRMKCRTFASESKGDQDDVESFMCVLLGEKLYTADVAFHSEENKAFLSAHSTVLAAKSKYFEDLLFGDLANRSGLKMDLEIRDVPFCIFFNIIKWFYTGKIEFSDVYTVLEIYQAARHFKIQQLIDGCGNYIKSMEITEHNVLSNLQLSNTMKIGELHRRCIKYIERNTFSVINSTEFLKSPFNLLRKIWQLQCLSLTSEVEVLEALLKWLNAQPKLKKSAVKSLERAVLRCVRFLSFSAEEFVNIMPKHAALFTLDESQNISMYLVDPNPEDLKTLPAWCSKSHRTLLSNPKSIGKRPLSTHSGVEKIEIQLKAPDAVQNITELTSILEMTCMNGMHRLKSVKLSFQAIGNKECVLEYLEIKVKVFPNGQGECSHREKHQHLLLKNSEITFDFSKGITVYEGQVLHMELTANISQSNFFEFHKWFPKSDFDCFFVSKTKKQSKSLIGKPIKGRLCFISEIVYMPLVP